ncbi:MAG: hypothetical protein JWQ43_2 [Glaciihabitans sp.]|nr:hypothetical protein [Glaciihabitans sp.]
MSRNGIATAVAGSVPLFAIAGCATGAPIEAASPVPETDGLLCLDLQNCPGDPATPIAVALAQPLGGREVVDAALRIRG